MTRFWAKYNGLAAWRGRRVIRPVNHRYDDAYINTYLQTDCKYQAADVDSAKHHRLGQSQAPLIAYLSVVSEPNRDLDVGCAPEERGETELGAGLAQSS
jgi:hypothetical protein